MYRFHKKNISSDITMILFLPMAYPEKTQEQIKIRASSANKSYLNYDWYLNNNLIVRSIVDSDELVTFDFF